MNIPALSNREISETSSPDDIFYLYPSDVTGYFAMWVIRQTPRGQPLILLDPLKSFYDYIIPFFVERFNVIPSEFTYKQLNDLIDGDVFATIPEILALNETSPDFIDLHALARNIFYDVVRENRINYGINKKITDNIKADTDTQAEQVRKIFINKINVDEVSENFGLWLWGKAVPVNVEEMQKLFKRFITEVYGK